MFANEGRHKNLWSPKMRKITKMRMRKITKKCASQKYLFTASLIASSDLVLLCDGLCSAAAKNV